MVVGVVAGVGRGVEITGEAVTATGMALSPVTEVGMAAAEAPTGMAARGRSEMENEWDLTPVDIGYPHPGKGYGDGTGNGYGDGDGGGMSGGYADGSGEGKNGNCDNGNGSATYLAGILIPRRA